MPEKYPYLAIDSTGELRVLMPVVSGDTIGLDNTCKTDKEIRDFLDKENGVIASLNNLRDDIKKSYYKC